MKIYKVRLGIALSVDNYLNERDLDTAKEKALESTRTMLTDIRGVEVHLSYNDECATNKYFIQTRGHLFREYLVEGKHKEAAEKSAVRIAELHFIRIPYVYIDYMIIMDVQQVGK